MNILLLTTGGTIACTRSPEGLVPSVDGNKISDSVPGITKNYNITVKNLLQLDSSNIQPEEWIIIAKNVYAAYRDFDGIVITHGTDTMAYTSSILSFMLVNPPVPIVLTGSQLPLLHPLTDATDNLRYAFAMASSKAPGVYIAFNKKIILGCRAVKVRTMGFDAFESINFAYAAVIDANGLNLNKNVIPEYSGLPSLNTSVSNAVFLIKLTPGFNPAIFDMLLKLNYKGIVIEAFGSGGLHFIHRDLISKLQKLIEHKIPVVISSQCLYEKSDLSLYRTGMIALETGVISAYDMTTEAVVTKLMWALGQTEELEEIRRIFSKSYVGEITPCC